MKKRPFKLQTLLALLYLTLSMAAAWHAPHDLGPRAELTIHVSTTSTATSDKDTDGFCALCSWQSLHQQTSTAVQVTEIAVPLAALPAPSLTDAPSPGFSLAHWARGPPSV